MFDQLQSDAQKAPGSHVQVGRNTTWLECNEVVVANFGTPDGLTSLTVSQFGNSSTG